MKNSTKERKRKWQTPEEMLEETKKACEKYGYRASENFGRICIRTNYEWWMFEQNGRGAITLYHGGLSGNNWHKQFEKSVLSCKNIVVYIHEHEVAKYTKRFVNFTYTRGGQRKAAMA